MNDKLKLAGAALGGVIATLAAGGIAMASMDHAMGPIGNADLDNNGEITRAEWVQKATQGFDAMDVNKDGKLVVGEIPAPPRHHGGRHGGPHGGPGGPGGWDRGGPDGPDGPEGVDDQAPPPPAAAPANATAPAPAATTAPQPAK